MVNSSANTVASGNSVRLTAHRYCPAKWQQLRIKCRPARRRVMAPNSAGWVAPNASNIASPPKLRIARISMMCRRTESTRTDTAMAENDTRAPTIHRTARARSRRCTLFGVRLAFRAGSFEGGVPGCGVVGGDDVGEALQRHLEAARVGDLRHEADVGDGHVLAELIGARPDQGLDRLEAYR